ncbi:MAG: sugar nucleotide-binding protein [Patescibacteria group bacterium]|nr:sugar nucleotide-binding protein [Patescibacteria group bacterium]
MFTEKDVCRPDDAYGISKWEAEQGLFELFTGQSGTQCIILRLPMVYGPGNKGNMLAFLKAASKKHQLHLRGVGRLGRKKAQNTQSKKLRQHYKEARKTGERQKSNTNYLNNLLVFWFHYNCFSLLLLESATTEPKKVMLNIFRCNWRLSFLYLINII